MASEDRSDWPSEVILGTASQGGTYYIYGAGLAGLINQELGTNITSEVTGGPSQNVSMVQLEEHELGLVTMGPAIDALKGESPVMPGVVHDKVRAVMPMYSSIFHSVALDRSGITSAEELDGKQVGVGPAGGTNSIYVPRIFELIGVDATFRDGGVGDQGGQVQDGLLDALVLGGGVPLAAYSQLEAQAEVNIFGFSEADVEAIVSEYPEFSKSVVPSSGYGSLGEDIQTVAMWNFVVAHADVPESLVYEIVKVIMESPEAIQQVHRSAQETLPENFIYNTQIPFHAGAVRWFEENGYEIPDDLKG
tara:strand:+ start:2526 stop:3443 length:918 start_codon:yes stop_codon:yes gene_type:complete